MIDRSAHFEPLSAASLSTSQGLQSRSRSPLPRWIVPVVVLVMLAAAGAVGVLLWRWIDSLALADPQKSATAHLDAVKIAASVAVGGGGLFALYLAVRRQRTQELELDLRHAELRHREAELAQRDRAQDDTRADAESRRITDLYTKASEQLGSLKAPVRQAGLYALERLAQDNPGQRQTVVNVLCAYQRMPFDLPGDPPDPQGKDVAIAAHREQVQERQVRLTAQRILRDHLRPGSDPDHPVDTFWPNIDIDLTGATLDNLDLSSCRLTAHFSEATFVGFTTFFRATFIGYTRFPGAAFTGPVVFDDVTFSEPAMFDQATFSESTSFQGARFIGLARFGKATFDKEARFDRTTFTSPSWEEGFAWFGAAMFTGPARFDGARFDGAAMFDGATVTTARFDGVLIKHPLSRHTVLPAGWRATEEHSAVKGSTTTWHRLLPAAPNPAGIPNPEAAPTM